MYVLNSTSAILTIENLSVGYDHPLLKNVSAPFGCGITGIIGNNGKGKTTLLRTLCGLLPPLAGKITLNGKDVMALSSAERARLISFNFSSNPVSFPISVHELVAMGRYPYLNQWAGLSAADEGVVARAIELCGIRTYRDKKVNALSDGERQKAFIAKSIAQETTLMLFDEPTAFLDYSSKKYFFNLVKDLAREKNKIVLVSSHDIDFLTAYADHLLMIEDDETIVFGSTAEVTSSAYFKAHFTKT